MGAGGIYRTYFALKAYPERWSAEVSSMSPQVARDCDLQRPEVPSTIADLVNDTRRAPDGLTRTRWLCPIIPHAQIGVRPLHSDTGTKLPKRSDWT
jgi:hypothetical protein